jgi:acyl dehydratase
MSLNRAFAGRVYPPTEPFEVSRDAIRRFAAAIGDDTPACHAVEAARALGHPDLVAPPTFAILLTMGADEPVVRDPELGLDYRHVVHREQRFRHHRPIRAGDVLRVTVTVTDVRTVARTDVLVTTAEVHTVAGEPVCETVCSLACPT